MQILWMTLVACTGLALAASLQTSALFHDSWWWKFSAAWQREQQQRSHEYQRQQFHLVPRACAYLGQITPRQPISPSQAQQAGRPSIRLQRLKLFPISTRLPFQKNLYFSGEQGPLLRQAFWRLADELYGRQSFYQQWRQRVDTDAFLEELLTGLGALVTPLGSPGTWALSLVQLSHPQDQEVWLQMLRGSDRLEAAYPSMLGYLWPTELAAAGSAARLNLVYANAATLRALLGASFQAQWQERIDEIKRQAGKEEAELDQWVLERASYQQIFQELCRELALDQQAYERVIDLTPGPFLSGVELIIRDERGIDHLASLQALSRK